MTDNQPTNTAPPVTALPARPPGPAGEPDRPERSYEEVWADAVRVLSEAARLTRPVLERDQAASQAAGHPVWTRTQRGEPGDWAEFVSEALAAATANVGSIEGVLAGRAGSWEADAVRNLLHSTVGWEEHDLLRRRTEPLVVDVYVSEILADAGTWTVYDDAQQVIWRRYEQVDAAPDLDDAERERRYDPLTDLEERLEQQRQDDWAAYGRALTTAVETAAAARYPDLPVPVLVRADLETLRADAPDTPWWGPAAQLRADAIAATPLPSAGRAPLDRLETPPTQATP